MTIRFDNQVAIVTGAGNGLGKSHALELARLGAKVVVNDFGGARDGSGGSTEAAEQVVAEIQAAGGEAIANGADVSSPEQVDAMVKQAMDTWGRIDVLINNAGILRDKSFVKMTQDDWDKDIAVHLTGSEICTRAVWPIMREQGYGRIVMTTSTSGLYGNFGQANYGAAKMALVGFTNVLAIEGASKNIKANVIAPVAKTRMTEDLLGPLGEKVAPQYVSPIVTYLAHESCEPTGRIFSVAGGRVAEIFIGEGPGFTDPDLSPESIAANFDQVTNRDTYDVPNQMGEEIGLYLKHLS